METGIILDSHPASSFSEFEDVARAACWIDAKKYKGEVQADPAMPGQYEIDSYRCTDCGFLEHYAGGTSKD